MSRLAIVDVETTDYVLLRVSGMIDSETAPQLDAACNRALERARPLVVNLGGVSFITSSGVGVLLAATEEFRDEGHALLCAAPSKEVRDVFDLLNLNEFLTLVDTEEQASQSLRKAA